jgi:anti-sigma-K factor RskA
MVDQQDCGMDAGAYVLGALDGDEAVAFRRHLMTCATCREEVDTLESAVAALPLMAPQIEAPPTLKRRVMAEVNADAKRLRAVEGEAGARQATRRGRSRGGWRPRPAAMLALAAAIALTVFISFKSPSTQIYQAAVAWHPGNAVLQVNNGKGQLLVTGMPAPPEGKVYEVWLEKGTGAPIPTAALFEVTSEGKAQVAVPSLDGVKKVLVTAERDGGSKVPTSNPVLVADLT